jgi:hypothetical protein
MAQRKWGLLKGSLRQVMPNHQPRALGYEVTFTSAIFYYLGDDTYCANPTWASCPHRMACLKCPMYVGKETAQLIEARNGVLHLTQEVLLTDEEKAVAEGDVAALNRYTEKHKDVPPPAVPNERYVFQLAQSEEQKPETG